MQIEDKMANGALFEGPITKGNYFLNPEDLFGIKYSTFNDGWPIPLRFYKGFPATHHPVTGMKYKIIFTGFRPADSLLMHKHYSASSLYPFKIDKEKSNIHTIVSQLAINKNPDKRRFIGMRPGLPNEYLHFESKYECGNLDRVVAISDSEYDLYIRSETNAMKSYSWFFFSVRNFKPGAVVKFNIVNLTDPPDLFNYGLAPVVSLNKQQWCSGCKNVEYLPSKLFDKIGKWYRSLYQLSFEFEFPEESKQVFFARSQPYSYSRLINVLSSYSEGNFLKKNTFVKTIGGVAVPLLTITDSTIEKKQKKYIIIVSRLCPGETVSSLIVEGLINFLMSDEPLAQKNREAFIYKIIPMANPEGVIAGNSRTNITGFKLHRRFSEFTDILSKLPKAITQLACKLQAKLGIMLYLELCASFKSLGSICFSTDIYRDKLKNSPARKMTELLGMHSDLSKYATDGQSMISDSSLQLSIKNDLGIETMSCQTSVFGYKDENELVKPHTPDQLLLHGEIIAKCIYKYSVLNIVGTLILPEASKLSIHNNCQSSSPSSSESLINRHSEFSLKAELIIREILHDETEIMNQSSSEEDDEIIHFLLDSFQQFYNLSNKKKIRSKIQLKTKLPNIVDQKKKFVIEKQRKISRNKKTLMNTESNVKKKVMNITSINFSENILSLTHYQHSMEQINFPYKCLKNLPINKKKND